MQVAVHEVDSERDGARRFHHDELAGQASAQAETRRAASPSGRFESSAGGGALLDSTNKCADCALAITATSF